MGFDPKTTEGIIAIVFICVTFVLLVVLLTTCIICWCWRYKLHKRKEELKAKDAEQGITTTKKSNCKCCGCWVYCCRRCRCCCESKDTKVEVIKPVDQVTVTVPTTSTTTAGCGCTGTGNQYGWTKDIYAYNTGTPTGITTSTSSVPVNFNNRWSSCNDGRLVLNGGGIVTKITPGIQTYGGGIYPGVSSSDQFLLGVKKL